MKTYLAVDMGASSGRHLAGHFDGNILTLEEIYRYENGPVEINGIFHWNLPSLWQSVKNGLQAAAEKCGTQIVSVGVDTWGVDFALLGKNNTLLSNPVCYRDARTDGIMDEAFKTVSRNEIFKTTGLQFMQFNTLYQLVAMKKQNNPLLDIAEDFLMMPDLFHYLLSGEKSNELTNATTTQFFNPVSGSWATDLLEKFSVPTKIFRPVSQPGTVLGNLRSDLAGATGLHRTKVILPGSHDTASAVMSVPTASKIGETNWAYVSLGTWALMGIESPKPVISETVEKFNFTNEGGVGGTMRILKNICGLWLLQECRRIWNLQRVSQRDANGSLRPRLDWEDLNKITLSAKPLVSFINPDAREFLSPTDMPKAIADFCRNTGQPVPQNEGAILRCALDSIAMRFRQVLEVCEKISGTTIETIHIVGGGTRNTLLCQAAANACGRRVVTGPIEATAIGNMMMQAVAAGDVADIEEARAVVRNSFDVMEYIPAPASVSAWNDAYERFAKIV